jgi:hypothetical protein
MVLGREILAIVGRFGGVCQWAARWLPGQALSAGYDDTTANDTLGDLVMTFPGDVHPRFSFLLASRRARTRIQEKG